jgi:uncharacterized membrane protein YuzA (DUF378 family)
LKVLHTIAFILLIIGGLNCGLVGAIHLNLVHKILGSVSSLENIVYILVGLSAIAEAVTHKAYCRTCAPSSATPVV